MSAIANTPRTDVKDANDLLLEKEEEAVNCIRNYLIEGYKARVKKYTNDGDKNRCANANLLIQNENFWDSAISQFKASILEIDRKYAQRRWVPKAGKPGKAT